VEKNVATEVNRRAGKLEQAQNGTLFLDEIGDMPLRVQNRLLRFLETRSFRRIGGREEFHTDVRVLAATNKNLDAEIEAGRFRDALRFRLDVVTIKLPPLRDRGDDLSLLADFFLDQALEDKNNKIQGFTADAWKTMKEYSWPGNVRELKHRVQAAAFLAKGSLISIHDLGLQKTPELSQILPLSQQKCNWEKHTLKLAIGQYNNKYDQAAASLGLTVRELERKLKKFNLVDPADDL
jgi:DNA-binding NtrC family response regulator